MDLGIKNKIAVVTGSARGLGHATAEKLAEEGVNVIITDVNKNLSDSTASEIEEKYKIKTLSFEHDVSSEESTKEVIKSVVKQFGRIDILVNNAGITKDARLFMMKKDDWQLVLSINLTGAFYCTKFISKQMLKQKSGNIVNIAVG